MLQFSLNDREGTEAAEHNGKDATTTSGSEWLHSKGEEMYGTMPCQHREKLLTSQNHFW